MLFILLLHVTDVFAMMLERQATVKRQTTRPSEATFASYEEEPVFADPQHKKYGVSEFWWERPTAKWEPRANVTQWYIEQSPSTEDLSAIWKEGLLDKKTSKQESKKDTTTKLKETSEFISKRTTTSPSSYKTTETIVTPTDRQKIFTKTIENSKAGPIFLIDKSNRDEEQKGPKNADTLGITKHDPVDLLTASSLLIPQQNADLIAIRAHPRKSENHFPFDNELYQQLRDVTSLREPDILRESPSIDDNKEVMVDKDKGKDLGLPGWKLQYPGRTSTENKSLNEFPALKDFIEIYPGENLIPLEKTESGTETTQIYGKKLFERSQLPASTISYQTSMNDTEYNDIINNIRFITEAKPYRIEINDEFQRYNTHDEHKVTANSNGDPDHYGYLENVQPQRPMGNSYHTASLPESQHNLEMGNLNGYTHPSQQKVYDLQLPDVFGKPVISAVPRHAREGTIEDHDKTLVINESATTNHSIGIVTNEGTTEQSSGSVTNEGKTEKSVATATKEPGTQTVASTITQQPVTTIQQRITNREKSVILSPVAATVGLTFTVPNMETTAATQPPTTTVTTTVTTKFTLEEPPLPLMNNLPNFDIDWDKFNLAVTTTHIPPLLHDNIMAHDDIVMTTVHPMVIEMRTEIVEQGIGYFTVFLRKLLSIASKKEEYALSALLKAGSESLERINADNNLYGLGRPMWPGIQLLFTYMRLMPLDTLKNQVMLAYMYYQSGAIFNNDAKFRDLNNRVDAIYQVREGENLMKTLVALEDFPGEHGDINANKVMEDIFRAMLAPWFRNKNSDTMYTLLNDLNEKLEDLQAVYLAVARRNYIQNKDTTKRLKTIINDSIENEKAYVGSERKKTENGSYYYDTSEEIINKFGEEGVIDNTVEHDDKITDARSINNKIDYNTKGTEATNNYNYVHNGDTIIQKPHKKYDKSYKDNKNSPKLLYTHDETSNDINQFISRSIDMEETRGKKSFFKSVKLHNTDLDKNNKNTRKETYFYKKDKLKKIYSKGGSKNDSFILQNKKTRNFIHSKKGTVRRNVDFTDIPTKPTNGYFVYYDDKHLNIIDKRVNMISISQNSALSKENHDYYTSDDRIIVNSRKIHKPGKKETKSNKNYKRETTIKKYYGLTDRTTNNIYDVYRMKTTNILKKDIKINELSKKIDNHIESYDESLDTNGVRHVKSKKITNNYNTIKPIKNKVRIKEKFEDKNILRNKRIENSDYEYRDSIGEDWAKKYNKIKSLNKNIDKAVNIKTDRHINAKKNKTIVKNYEKHGSRKLELSERVFQKRFKIKHNLADTKKNTTKNKIWQKQATSFAPVTKAKKHGNKIVQDFQKISLKSVNKENKENFGPHSKSQYLVNDAQDAASYLKERFLDFNRGNNQNKARNILRSLDNNKNILRIESSYSDEEEVLKSNLQDNLLHGGRNFTYNLHKFKNNNVIRDISSYSDEEDTLKKNIYKMFT